MAIDYYSKYLKYKSKYLELKTQLGSGKGSCTQEPPSYWRGVSYVKKCLCNKYRGNKPTPKNSNPICQTYIHLGGLYNEESPKDKWNYTQCGHRFSDHMDKK